MKSFRRECPFQLNIVTQPLSNGNISCKCLLFILYRDSVNWCGLPESPDIRNMFGINASLVLKKGQYVFPTFSFLRHFYSLCVATAGTDALLLTNIPLKISPTLTHRRVWHSLTNVCSSTRVKQA